jgi:hypothetical protein
LNGWSPRIEAFEPVPRGPAYRIEVIGFDPWGSGDPSAHEGDEQEQNDRAGSSRDQLPGEIAAWKQSKLRQQPSADDGTDDADRDVADETKSVTLDDDSGQPARDRADDEQD